LNRQPADSLVIEVNDLYTIRQEVEPSHASVMSRAS